MDSDSSSKFISSLTKFLQSLCNGYVEFQRGVELVGHIYLNIDTGEKVDYILHEKVSKNDENSVTFVSNSFHAQPQEKTEPKKNSSYKASVDDRDSDDDDDDIMIVDQSKDAPGSTNFGTIPSRTAKHTGSSYENKQTDGSLHQNQSSTNPLSPQRNRQHSGRPSATVTSQGTPQENINIGEVKLEQISSDELLSLTSQVDGGDSASNFPDIQSHAGGQGRVGRRAFSDTAGQPVWVKQEPGDDAQGGPDTGWSQSGDGQSDSSNSSSNIYPMMMHQNPAGFHSSPVFPGFSSSGSGSQHSFPRSRAGSSGAANPFANPMPGTSQSMDPAGTFSAVARSSGGASLNRLQHNPGQYSSKNSVRWQRYMQRVRSNPEHTFRHRLQNREKCKRYREKKKIEREYLMWRQSGFSLETSHTGEEYAETADEYAETTLRSKVRQ